MIRIVQLPQAIGLDTAILALWAYHWAKGDSRARRLVEMLLRSNARVLMTFHHVIELLGHDSDDVVEDRARFVRTLEQLFWIKACNRDGIGAILDLQAREIRARFDAPDATYPQLLSRVRPDVFAFGDSRDISSLMQEPVFIEAARERVQRRRVVALETLIARCE